MARTSDKRKSHCQSRILGCVGPSHARGVKNESSSCSTRQGAISSSPPRSAHKRRGKVPTPSQPRRRLLFLGRLSLCCKHTRVVVQERPEQAASANQAIVSEMSLQYAKELNMYVVRYGDQFDNIMLLRTDLTKV